MNAITLVAKAAKSGKIKKPNVKLLIEPLMKLSPHEQLRVGFINKTEKEMKAFSLVPHFLKGIVLRNVGYVHIT